MYPSICKNDHDGDIFSKVLYRVTLPFPAYVRPWWFCLLKDSVYNSPHGVCLFSVEWSYCWYYLGDYRDGWDVHGTTAKFKTILEGKPHQGWGTLTAGWYLVLSIIFTASSSDRADVLLCLLDSAFRNLIDAGWKTRGNMDTHDQETHQETTQTKDWENRFFFFACEMTYLET